MGANNPCILSVSAHIPYVSLVLMYWAIVFCCWVIYASIGHSTDSSRASPISGYNQLTSGCRRGFVPVSQWVTKLWNLPSARRGQGTTTHVSSPKGRTDCTTTPKQIQEVFASTPSHPRMCHRIINLSHAFLKLATTVGQFSFLKNNYVEVLE